MTKAQEKKLLAIRGQQLESLGLTHDGGNDGTGYSKDGVTITYEAIITHTAETWEQLISQFSQAKEQPQESKELSIVALQELPTSAELLKAFQLELSTKVEAVKKLTILSYEDKEGYKAVFKAKNEMVKLRTSIEKTRKEVKDQYLKAGTAVDSRAKQLFEVQAPGEAHAVKLLEQWEQWKTAEETRLEQERTAERDRRVKLLTEAGIMFNGVIYCIGEINIDLFTIEALTAEQFNDLLGKVQVVKSRIDTEAKEREEKEQKEREEAEKQRQEVERQRQENEAKEKALAAKVEAMRKKELKFAGFIANSFDDIFTFKNDFYDVALTIERVKSMSDEDFQLAIDRYTDCIADAKKLQTEKDTRVETRTKQLISLGYSICTGGYWYAAISETTLLHNGIVSCDNEYWDKVIADNNITIAASNMYEARVKELQEMGLVFADNYYQIVIGTGKTGINCTNIKNANGDEWVILLHDLCLKIKELTQEAEQAKTDAERKQKEQEQEYQRRTTQLLGLGMQTNANHFYFWYDGKNHENLYYSFNWVNNRTAEEWHTIPQFVADSIQKIKDDVQAEADRIAAEKEAAKPEIEKAREYIQSLLDITAPKFTIGNIDSAMYVFTNSLSNAARQAMNELDHC